MNVRYIIFYYLNHHKLLKVNYTEIFYILYILHKY